MKVKDRMFYFFRNLLAYILMIPCGLIFSVYNILYRLKAVFITDGSELIDFPWQYPWNLNRD